MFSRVLAAVVTGLVIVAIAHKHFNGVTGDVFGATNELARMVCVVVLLAVASMGVVALVMAGGKGTRMKAAQEKPLIEVCGKPVIQYVLSALRGAKKINRVIVATSNCTPKTTRLMRQLGVEVIETPGKDYVSDMGYVVQTLKLGVFLAIAADLPLVRGEMIDAVVDRYECCGKPALTVAVPLETKAKLGMCIEYSFKLDDMDVVPVGINVSRR